VGRIACAFVPRFELALRARADRELWHRPLAVVELAGGAQRVRVCTPAAQKLGVATGQPLSQARAACPALEVLAPDEAAHREAEKEVLARLAEHSPWLDSDGAGAFFLGLAGLGQLVKNERHFGEAVAQALRPLGFDAHVAVADGPFVAWVTARRKAGVSVIAPGEELLHLAHVPLAELGLTERAQELLSLLGVKTAGALAKLPAGALSRRLGAEGTYLERLCQGRVLNAWPTAARVPVPAESVSLELETPNGDLEPLLFLAKSLLDRLLPALARARTALVELTVIARLDTRAELRHALRPHQPTLDARAVVDVLRLWLDSKPFAAPVAALTLVASKTGPAQARQMGLFHQRQQEEYASLERAVAKLASAFGTEAVVRPTLSDTFRPEARLRWVPFAPGAVEEATGSTAIGPPPMVLKLMTPPEPVRWTAGWLHRPGKAAEAVAHVDGPNRLCGEWWEAPFDRSYFWIGCDSGALYWVFRDEATGKSYLAAEGD